MRTGRFPRNLAGKSLEARLKMRAALKKNEVSRKGRKDAKELVGRDSVEPKEGGAQ